MPEQLVGAVNEKDVQRSKRDNARQTTAPSAGTGPRPS